MQGNRPAPPFSPLLSPLPPLPSSPPPLVPSSTAAASAPLAAPVFAAAVGASLHRRLGARVSAGSCGLRRAATNRESLSHHVEAGIGQANSPSTTAPSAPDRTTFVKGVTSPSFQTKALPVIFHSRITANNCP